MKKKIESNNEVDELKDRIIETSKSLFLRYGFSRVTTNEISKTIGISKKTLYKIYPKKEILVEEVFKKIRNKILLNIDDILNDNSIDLINKIKQILKTTAITLSKIDKDIINDLKKSYPKIVKNLEKFESDQLLIKIEDLINDGVEKGYFKKGIDIKIFVRFFFESIKNFISIENIEYLNVPIQDFFDSILIIIFEGVLTENVRNEFHQNVE